MLASGPVRYGGRCGRPVGGPLAPLRRAGPSGLVTIKSTEGAQVPALTSRPSTASKNGVMCSVPTNCTIDL